jgi:hypothetical protein
MRKSRRPTGQRPISPPAATAKWCRPKPVSGECALRDRPWTHAPLSGNPANRTRKSTKDKSSEVPPQTALIRHAELDSNATTSAYKKIQLSCPRTSLESPCRSNRSEFDCGSAKETAQFRWMSTRRATADLFPASSDGRKTVPPSLDGCDQQPPGTRIPFSVSIQPSEVGCSLGPKAGKAIPCLRSCSRLTEFPPPTDLFNYFIWLKCYPFPFRRIS